MRVTKLILWGVAIGAIIALAYLFSTGGLQVSAPKALGCDVGPLAETSTDYLQRQAHCLYGATDTKTDKIRLTLVDDIYIKSWSYALLNKMCYWLSIGLAVLILLYPALGPVLKSEDDETALPGWVKRALSTSSVQTSLTALAAASFAFYAHYKERQSIAETLMRTLVVAETVTSDDLKDVVKQIAQMDKGFGFATATSSQP